MANKKAQPIQNAGEIIELFGGIRPMAAKIDTPVTTVQGWKKRDVIPATRRAQILAAAQDNNIDLSDVSETSTSTKKLPKATAKKKTSASKKTAASKKAAPKTAPQKQTEKPVTPVPVATTASKSNKEEEKVVVSKAEEKQAAPKSQSHDEILKQIDRKNQKAVISSIWITVTLVLLGLVMAAFLLWPLLKENMVSDNPEMVQKIEQLETKLDDVEQQTSFFGGTVSADMQQRINSLQTQAKNIQAKVSDLSSQAEIYTEEVIANNAQPLINRLEMLEKKVELLSDTGDFSGLISRIQGLENSLAGQEQLQNSVNQLQRMVRRGGTQGVSNEDLATIQNQNQGPLGQTLQGVSNNDLKAAAMLLAFSKFRDSLNREEGFEDDLMLLQKLIGEDNQELQASLQKLAPQAREGVLTPKGLSDELRSATGDIVFSSLNGEDVSIKEKTVARINNVFQVEKEGEPLIGTETQMTVAKAQKLLDQGKVQEAVNVLNALDGEAAQTARPIIDNAQATLLAQRVEEMISNNILSKVTGMNLENAVDNFDLQSIKQNLENTLPEIQSNSDIIKDDASGLSILPRRQNFKGFSGGQNIAP